MHLGMAFVYVCLALALDSMTSLLLLIPLLITIHYGVVAREERYLAEKFGDAYQGYRVQVRPWL